MTGVFPDADTLRNLKDAGCGSKLMEAYCGLEQPGNACDRAGQIRLLREHRKALLRQLHQAQQQLDCLDYLLFRLEGRVDKPCKAPPKESEA